VKAVLGEALEEEMTEHFPAGYRERTPRRRGERKGHYTRNLITPVRKVERLRVPRENHYGSAVSVRATFSPRLSSAIRGSRRRCSIL